MFTITCKKNANGETIYQKDFKETLRDLATKYGVELKEFNQDKSQEKNVKSLTIQENLKSSRSHILWQLGFC